MSLPRITKSVVSFVVLHRAEDDLTNFSLSCILRECETGDMIRGPVSVAGGGMVIPTRDVLEAELHEIGNDGSFFDV